MASTGRPVEFDIVEFLEKNPHLRDASYQELATASGKHHYYITKKVIEALLLERLFIQPVLMPNRDDVKTGKKLKLRIDLSEEFDRFIKSEDKRTLALKKRSREQKRLDHKAWREANKGKWAELNRKNQKAWYDRTKKQASTSDPE